jgi:hypothetical protein
LNTEKRWLLLARSYDLSERVKDFTRAIPDRPDAGRKNVTEHVRSEPPLHNWEEDLQTVVSNTPFMLTRSSQQIAVEL